MNKEILKETIAYGTDTFGWQGWYRFHWQRLFVYMYHNSGIIAVKLHTKFHFSIFSVAFKHFGIARLMFWFPIVLRLLPMYVCALNYLSIHAVHLLCASNSMIVQFSTFGAKLATWEKNIKLCLWHWQFNNFKLNIWINKFSLFPILCH